MGQLVPVAAARQTVELVAPRRIGGDGDLWRHRDDHRETLLGRHPDSGRIGRPHTRGHRSRAVVTDINGDATIPAASLAGINVGTYIGIVTATFAGTSASIPASGSDDLTVTPAPLTITADNQTKVYGAALPTLTASYTGFVNGDTSASLATLPTLTTTATAASHVAGSPYSITASGAVDTNYAISYVDGSLAVTAAPLTITADNQAKVYGAALPTLTASYTGFVNGDDVHQPHHASRR